MDNLKAHGLTHGNLGVCAGFCGTSAYADTGICHCYGMVAQAFLPRSSQRVYGARASSAPMASFDWWASESATDQPF